MTLQPRGLKVDKIQWTDLSCRYHPPPKHISPLPFTASVTSDTHCLSSLAHEAIAAYLWSKIKCPRLPQMVRHLAKQTVKMQIIGG